MTSDVLRYGPDNDERKEPDVAPISEDPNRRQATGDNEEEPSDFDPDLAAG